MASRGRYLLPSPGVTWLPIFSGTVLAGNHSPRWDIPQAVCLWLYLYSPSNLKCPGLSWHGSVNFLWIYCSGLWICYSLWIWKGRELLSHNHWPGSPPKLLGQPRSPVQGLDTFLLALKISLLSIFKCLLQPLASKRHYQLEFCWLFTLFFGRSARCPSGLHEQMGSAPTYIATFFLEPGMTLDCSFCILNMKQWNLPTRSQI